MNKQYGFLTDRIFGYRWKSFKRVLVFLFNSDEPTHGTFMETGKVAVRFILVLSSLSCHRSENGWDLGRTNECILNVLLKNLSLTCSITELSIFGLKKITTMKKTALKC